MSYLWWTWRCTPGPPKEGITAQLQGVWPGDRQPQRQRPQFGLSCREPLEVMPWWGQSATGYSAIVGILPFRPRAPHWLSQPWGLASRSTSIFVQSCFYYQMHSLKKNLKNPKLIMSHECGTKNSCSEGPEKEDTPLKAEAVKDGFLEEVAWSCL